MKPSTMTLLQDSAQRLFPTLNFDQAMAQLLLERAQKNLIRHRTTAREFEAKYGVDFPTFRQRILAAQPAFAMEQDYFDWEMSVAAALDMEEEIARLRRLVPSL